MPRALTVLQVLSADLGKVHLFQHMGCWRIFRLLLETASRERGTRCSRPRRAHRQRGWHRGEGSKRPPHGPGRPGCGTQRAALLQKDGVTGMSLKPAAPGRGRWARGSGTRDPAPSAQPPGDTGRPQQRSPNPHGSHPLHPFSGLSEPVTAAGEKAPPQECVKMLPLLKRGSR